MQFKTLFTALLSVSLPLLTHASPNSPEQAALEDVKTLSTDLTNLDHAVQKWDGNVLSALSLQRDASSAQDDIDQALEDTKKIESIEPETREKLATALREMEPRAVHAVGHLVDKQPQFAQAGLGDLILKGLRNLKDSLKEFETTLKPKIDNGDEAKELSHGVGRIQQELDKAISAFS